MSSEQWVKPVVKVRFGQADRLKMNRIVYTNDMLSAHTSGRLESIQKLVDSHRNEPFKNVDEVMGDVQIIIKDAWNEFQKYNKQQCLPLSLEQIMNNDMKVLKFRESAPTIQSVLMNAKYESIIDGELLKDLLKMFGYEE